MAVRITESIWLNTQQTCTFEHILEVSGLSKQELNDLIDTGVIEPAQESSRTTLFQSQCIVLARRARRLRDDFELDMSGVSLALKLLERIDELESRLKQAGLNTQLTDKR